MTDETTNGNGAKIVKPKLQYVIEYLDHSYEYVLRAMQLLSSIHKDLEKGADFIAGYRDSMIKAMESTGGQVGGKIEMEIGEFLQKKYRPLPNEEQQAA